MPDPTPQLSTVAAANIDLKSYGGDTFFINLTFADGDNNPIDFSGSSIVFSVRKQPRPDSPIIFSASTLEGTIVIDTNPPHNDFNIKKTMPLEGGVYFYDIQRTDNTGFIASMQYGKLTIIQAITAG